MSLLLKWVGALASLAGAAALAASRPAVPTTTSTDGGLPRAMVLASLPTASGAAHSKEFDVTDQSTLHNTPVYPLPQEITLTGGDMPLAQAVIAVPAGASADERAAADLLAGWLADEYMLILPVVESPAIAGRKAIYLARCRGLRSEAQQPRLAPVTQPEGYTLAITPDGATAMGADQRGLLYAAATIIQLVRRTTDGPVLLGANIRDWPFMSIRYVHIFLPGPDDMPLFRRYVRDVLLRYKFNGMILEVGGGVRLTSHPEIAPAWRRTTLELRALGDQFPKTGESTPQGPNRRFQDTTHIGLGGGRYIEPDDLRELVAFARQHGQEVVPEIQSLTHVYHLTCAHRELAEVPEAAFPDAYCPSNEDSYKLLFDVMDEYIDMIKPPAVHIGHDEWRSAGLCPRCRDKDTGQLYAQDVIRIYRHLHERGIATWMWADHFTSCHNEKKRSLGKGGPMWYDFPSTEGAWKKVLAECPDILLFNWAWSMRDQDGRQAGAADAELRAKGFRFGYGNFYGQMFENWPERPIHDQVPGAEVSSWCRMEEYELGKMHIAHALYSTNMLWSSHYLSRPAAAELVFGLMPQVREHLSGTFEPDIHLHEPQQSPLDLAGVFNVPLKHQQWDLSGLRLGESRLNGLQCKLGSGGVMVRRTHQDAAHGPEQVVIPIARVAGKLTFVQTSTGEGRRPVHAGDGTLYPRESSELLGVYDVVFEDGLVLPAGIRYQENVAAWNAGLEGTLYHARCLIAGDLPGGGPLVIWGYEWTNPRPEVRIVEIHFRGAGGDSSYEPSQAQPILLGITATDSPQLADYRPTQH